MCMHDGYALSMASVWRSEDGCAARLHLYFSSGACVLRTV